MKRSVRTCIHEAGHIIAAKHLAGPSVNSLTWYEEGGATVGLIYDAPPLKAAVIAVAGFVANRLLSPHEGAAISPTDAKQLEAAHHAWSGATRNTLNTKAFSNAVFAMAGNLVRMHHAEILELASTLHKGGSVPDEYMHPASLALQEEEKIMAQAGQLLHRARQEREHKAAAPPRTQFTERLEAGYRLAASLSGRTHPRKDHHA